jgi:hypothetical protein
VDVEIPLNAEPRTSDVKSGLILYRNDAMICTGDSDALLAEHLLSAVCHDLADCSQGGMLFHAAALCRQGKGLLLPGKVSAGKTTLTAWLLSKGWLYLTDELVFIASGANVMQVLTRPLNLKRSARSPLAPYFDVTGFSGQVLSTARADLLSHSAFHPQVASPEVFVDRIIFPSYQSQASFIFQSLSKAQGAASLMVSLVNARNLPEMGFQEAVRLAKSVPAYKLQYANFDQIEAQFDVIFRL